MPVVQDLVAVHTPPTMPVPTPTYDVILEPEPVKHTAQRVDHSFVSFVSTT